MIFEHAILQIVSGREAEFEAAFPAAAEIAGQARGCHGAEIRRCIETPGQYQLIIGWDSVDDHMVGFRESPLFAQWRAAIGEFFHGAPTVAHYEPVG